MIIKIKKQNIGMCVLIMLNINLFAVRPKSEINDISFTTQRELLKPSLILPFEDELEDVSPSVRKLMQRVRKSEKDKTIPPLEIVIPESSSGTSELINTISKKNYRRLLRSKILETSSRGENSLNAELDTSAKTFRITSELLKYLDLEGLASLLQKPHHQLTLGSDYLLHNSEIKNEFLDQLNFILSKDQVGRVKNKISKSEELIVDRDLLTPFAQKMVTKFLIHQGPNCFHAALAFFGSFMTVSNTFNIKVEEGYHPAMINYDELWRALKTSFYEVYPQKSSLKYGDVLVFFDIPANAKNEFEPNFRWIRHASVYLFSNYVFSKGSKSPATPYTVKTLDDEWSVWKKYMKNKMGVKIFRRFDNKKSIDKEILKSESWLF